MAGTFQATISGKLAPLINMRNDNIDIDTMITTYNTEVTDTASEVLGKKVLCNQRCRDVLDFSDERRDSKKRWYQEEGAK